MCDDPVPCPCTVERRSKLRGEASQRQDDLRAMWSRLRSAGQLTAAEDELLVRKIEEEWDDAIHIASPDDPLRSLCGSYGRNLTDLPERPDGASGCWGCLDRADAVSSARELAPSVTA